MQRSRRGSITGTCLVLLALLLAGYQTASMAASLGAQADVVMYEGGGATSSTTSSICHQASFGLSAAVCLGSYNFLDSSLSYYGWGQASYGTLKVFGSSSISQTATGSGGPLAITTGGFTGFRDQWMVLGPSGTGALELTFDVTATYNDSMPFTDIYGSLSIYNYNNGTDIFPTGDYQLPPAGSGTWSATGVFVVPITFGEILDFEVFMNGGSILYNLFNGGYNGQYAYFNLSDTAVMSSIVVKDNNGNVVPFSLSTASGAALFNELASSSNVPLPPALWLFGSGLLGLIGIARRKKAA